MAEGRRAGSRRHYSAGGVLVGVRDGVPQVVLIATRKGNRWGLPKGAVDRGETAEQAALREVLEETGLRGEVLVGIDRIEYFFRAEGVLIRKHVDFFLMRYVGGRVKPQLSEVDDARWFPLEEAIAVSTFESERKVLEQALQSWKEMPDRERGRFLALGDD